MDSRRHDDFMAVSPNSRQISRKHRYDSDPDQFPMPRRSLTPQRGADRPRRVERMGRYGPRMGGDGSGSGRFHKVEQRPYFDEDDVHRNYDASRHIHFDANDNSRSKQVYGYDDHGAFRTGRENYYGENRIEFDVMDVREMPPHKTMLAEDEAAWKSYRLSPDLGPSNYLEAGKDFTLSSQSADMSRFEREKFQYLEPRPMDNLPAMEPYRAEKPILHSRDDTYKDFANSSSGISGAEVMDAYKDGLPSWHLQENSHGGKIGEPTGSDAYGYGRRSCIESGIDPEAMTRKGAFSPTMVEREDYFFPKSRRITNDDDGGYRSGNIQKTMPSHSQLDYDHRLMDYDHRDISRSGVTHPVLKRDEIVEDSFERPHKDSGIDREVRMQKGAFSPTRVEHEDNFFPKSRRIANDDDGGYQSGSIHRIMPSHSELDYDNRLMDYDNRDLSRSTTVMRPALRRDEIAEDSHGNRKESRQWCPALQKPTGPDYLDITRTENASKQRDEYLGSGSTHVDYERSVLRDHEMLEMATSHDRLDRYLRPDQSFARDTSPGNQKERPLKVPPMSSYEAEIHRRAIRTHKREEFGSYETPDRVLKRKYRMEKDIRRHNARSIMTGKWNEPREYEDLHDGDDHWTNEDMRDAYPYKPVGFDYDDCREVERRHHHNHIDYAPDDLPPSRYSPEHSDRHSVQSYKHGNGNSYTKGHSRHGSSSWHDSNNFNRSVNHKQHNVWKRIDGYHDGKRVNNGQSELLENAERSEPSEEGDEFMKLVHEAFLKYSKKLNINPSVRRRYLEQGKAGSLFCIVCGSFSKEFMDTRRLGTHAFMSHKPGMRIEHMGLLKAICVLLGWNNVVAPGTVTWTPEVLPDAEAWAQKEDLILWPPLVIIHNISPPKRNHQAQKDASAEGLEAFLRGKGFGGKYKLCQGNPKEESIMVVIFPRTFTGLENAERLHKELVDDKRGRVDFHQHMPGSRGAEEENAAVIYGYMGIVEDFDKLDHSTKMTSWIKSKKEILNIANAPVKLER